MCVVDAWQGRRETEEVRGATRLVLPTHTCAPRREVLTASSGTDAGRVSTAFLALVGHTIFTPSRFIPADVKNKSEPPHATPEPSQSQGLPLQYTDELLPAYAHTHLNHPREQRYPQLCSLCSPLLQRLRGYA